MLKSSAPPGYKISFNRHIRRWGWKRQYPKDDGVPPECFTFKSHAAANKSAHEAKAAEQAKASEQAVKQRESTLDGHDV